MLKESNIGMIFQMNCELRSRGRILWERNIPGNIVRPHHILHWSNAYPMARHGVALDLPLSTIYLVKYRVPLESLRAFILNGR